MASRTSNTCSRQTDAAAGGSVICMPCDDEKALRHTCRCEQSPEKIYWLELVARVHHGAGFEALPDAEKAYFAVSCLRGEVLNGGFYQFFSNSSGALYWSALDGLKEMGADLSVQLTIRAREFVFGSQAMPMDSRARNQLLPDIEGFDVELSTIDESFFQNIDEFDARRKQFAQHYGLY